MTLGATRTGYVGARRSRSGPGWRPRRVGIGLAALLLPAAPLSAQTLTGRVLEDGREVPVAGADVALLDAGGRILVRVESDPIGRFSLTPPEAGEYVVQATRIGYEPTRSPLLALEADGTAALDLLMRPRPIGLEGFEVTTDRPAEELLVPFGLRAEDLGSRWIDRQEIDAMLMPGSAGDVILWQNIPGAVVDLTDGPNGSLCVRVRASGRCATVYLNGIHIDSVTAQALDPRGLEAIAVLRPTEASLFFGTGNGSGAVLLWTRRGRP